jgi:DNA-binding MarR family transcriptional regulator
MVVTPSQGFVLHFVAEHEAANVKAIARALNISSSAATQLIAGLEEKGYVVRQTSPNDRRAISLSLSDKAKKLFKEFKEQRLKKMIEVFEALSDEELAQYSALNKKIAESINKSSTE